MVRGAVRMLTPVKEMGRAWEAEMSPTINLVVSELFKLTDFLKVFVNDRQNRGEGVTFGRALLDNIKARFPSCGTNVEVYAVANFVDPNKKFISKLWGRWRRQKKPLRESVISLHQLPK